MKSDNAVFDYLCIPSTKNYFLKQTSKIIFFKKVIQFLSRKYMPYIAVTTNSAYSI